MAIWDKEEKKTPEEIAEEKRQVVLTEVVKAFESSAPEEYAEKMLKINPHVPEINNRTEEEQKEKWKKRFRARMESAKGGDDMVNAIRAEIPEIEKTSEISPERIKKIKEAIGKITGEYVAVATPKKLQNPKYRRDTQ